MLYELRMNPTSFLQARDGRSLSINEILSLMTGMSASPDGVKVAWTLTRTFIELPGSEVTAEAVLQMKEVIQVPPDASTAIWLINVAVRCFVLFHRNNAECLSM